MRGRLKPETSLSRKQKQEVLVKTCKKQPASIDIGALHQDMVLLVLLGAMGVPEVMRLHRGVQPNGSQARRLLGTARVIRHGLDIHWKSPGNPQKNQR